MSQYGNLLYSIEEYSKPNWTPTRTEMGDPSKLAQSLGITYDYDSILNKFNDVTKAQMDLAKKQQTHNENKYYSDMYNTQMSSLDTIKKANAQAVATGASRGMQAANELSSILGLQQESVAGATDLAAERSALIDKEREAYATNALNALQQANNTALSLGNLNANIYATDTQFDVGQMDYYARLDAARKQLMAAQEQANGNRYAADQNLAGMLAQASATASAGRGSGGSGGTGGSDGVDFDNMNEYELFAYFTANGADASTAQGKVNQILANRAGNVTQSNNFTTSAGYSLYDRKDAVSWYDDRYSSYNNFNYSPAVNPNPVTQAPQYNATGVIPDASVPKELKSKNKK